jgi:hypothetical protein
MLQAGLRNKSFQQKQPTDILNKRPQPSQILIDFSKKIKNKIKSVAQELHDHFF